MGVITVVAFFFRTFAVPRAVLAAENLALRQQLALLQVSMKRPRLRKRDRVLWVRLSRLWSGRRSGPIIVKPETAKGGKSNTRPSRRSPETGRQRSRRQR